MGLLLYNCFLLLYRMGIRLVSLWNPKAKRWLKGRVNWKDALAAHFTSAEPPLIWMHCASLGEFEQGRPVLEKIKAHYPGYRILLTFFSPSGYEVRKNYEGADIVCYLPMDSAAAARRFLDIAKPSLVLWVKYDYWYYFLTEIHRRRLPLLLISGVFRDDQPFFKWYGSLHRKMLQCFTHLFVQTRDAAKLLATLHLPGNVTVSGDTRFDRVADIAAQWEPVPLIEDFCGSHPVIVAGSTWPEDEEELDHYANTHPEIRFIIAPHEIGEEHLRDIERLFKNTVRYSQLLSAAESSPRYSVRPGAGDSRLPVSAPNTLLVDNIGMLSKLYKYATITYIGGGFGDDGVHNVLEAAVYGRPVVHGPVYEKYREAADLVDAGGAFSVTNALELESVLNRLLENKERCAQAGAASLNYVSANKGATETILRYLQEKRLLIS